MKLRFLLALVITAASLLWSEPVLASNSLLDATDEICKDIRAFLDKQEKNKVRIAQFVGEGPEAKRASTSSLLCEALKLSLQKKKIEVVDAPAQSHFVVSGTFQAIEDVATRRQAVILSVVLDDQRGNRRKFQGVSSGKANGFFFDNMPDLARVLGLSVYAPPGQVPDIANSIDHPACSLDGTRILAGTGAPFAIEVLVAPDRPGKRTPADFKVRQPEKREVKVEENGAEKVVGHNAFVPIQRGEAYGVRLYNNSDFEVAVDLRLDGISMYHFSEKRDQKGGPAYRYVIIPAKRSVEIRGWFVNLNDSDEFLVVPRANSVFAQLSAHNPAAVGTITALFHRAWDPKQGRPADEPANPARHSLSADATGRGQRFNFNYVEVDYEVGTLRAAVSARYTKQ